MGKERGERSTVGVVGKGEVQKSEVRTVVALEGGESRAETVDAPGEKVAERVTVKGDLVDSEYDSLFYSSV